MSLLVQNGYLSELNFLQEARKHAKKIGEGWVSKMIDWRHVLAEIVIIYVIFYFIKGKL